MKRIAFLLLFFVYSASLFGQYRTDTFHLWKDVIPLEDRPRNDAKVMADTSRQVIRLTDVSDPILIAYHPEIKSKGGTSVVICPGGGYHHLAMNLEGSDIASWFNSQGVTAFVLQYRVPSRREAALRDLQKALAVVYRNANKWQLDPGKIGVMGFSAGGHLAMRAIFERVRSDHYKPAFGILVYPAYFDEGSGKTLSPEFDLSVELPPVFIFGTADDKYAHSALVMVKALTDAGMRPEFHLMPEGGHGYGMRQNNPAGKVWPNMVLEWMEQHGF